MTPGPKQTVPSMYNLLVSSKAEAWNGEPWQIELSRCVREYTENEITGRFGALDEVAVSELKRLPCIFAYEVFNRLAPKFGLIRDVAKRQGQVRIEYELQAVDPFLSAEDLEQLTVELDIGKWEMNRTHWAVKDLSLAKETACCEVDHAAFMDGASDQDRRYHQA
jgi:hypothetical protein